MAFGNGHLEMVDNVGGESRPSPGEKKENPHLSENSTGLLPKPALGFCLWGSQIPDLINIKSSKTKCSFILPWPGAKRALFESFFVEFKRALF